jgi:hypothetical protein
MLLHTSINRYQKLVQECIPTIKKGQRRQFVFGLNALAARPFVSLNSNARTAGSSRAAAESKMARLLRNTKLQQQLTRLHLTLSAVKATSIVNIDHSEFHGLNVLLFARQTYAGRALPVYLETMPSHVQGHKASSSKYLAVKARYQAWKQQTGLDQYSHTIHCIDKLAVQLGLLPKLVFDRGFCNKRLLKYLKRQKTTSYVRARAWFSVVTEEGRRQRIAAFAPGSYMVRFGCKLRLVVGQPRRHHDEPWYILTIDLRTNPDRILKIYYHRFEIEELFRDLKSLLQTKNSRLKKAINLATLLWYVCLGIILLWLSQPQILAIRHTHAKKKLSLLRVLCETFERELRSYYYFNGHAHVRKHVPDKSASGLGTDPNPPNPKPQTLTPSLSTS